MNTGSLQIALGMEIQFLFAAAQLEKGWVGE